ncbi:MAG: cbb3-type cytochrome c oxidase subunit II [Mangrovicoccus sp.]|nr:cbb3-type cytochrome c oxidase subunit II [Mangrovicoccus sp.]
MADLNHIFHTRPVVLVITVGLVFAFLSWVVALGPALRLRAQTLQVIATQTPLEPSIQRGKAIYMAEGCGYCHSQFVRATFVDASYGRAHTAADYAGQNPPMPGSQRTGPDLSNLGNRQPSWTWNFAHLYNPRSMVPESIMPSFPWLFEVMTRQEAASHTYGDYALAFSEPFLAEGMVVVPRDTAVDLVAYLRSLKQD